MALLYLDFNTTNNNEYEVNAESQIQLTALPKTQFNRISLSKLDLTLSNLYFMKVPLVNKQVYYDSAHKQYDLYSQDEGWYETIFKFVYFDANNQNGVIKSIYFKSQEESDYKNIPYTSETISGTEYRTYDNHNKFFIVKNLNNLLNNINENIKNYLKSLNDWSETEAKVIGPTFYTKENVLYCDCLYSVQEGSVNHSQVQKPSEATGNSFCFGINKELAGLLYKPFLCLHQEINGEEFVFLDNSITGRVNVFTISLPSSGEPIPYNICSFLNTDYIDFKDIKTLIINTNLSVVPLMSNYNNKSFELQSKDIVSSVSEQTIFKMNIQDNAEQLFRLVYSNPNIRNNASGLINLTNTNYKITIKLLDKYNNIYDLKMEKGDSIYVQLLVFNE